MTTAMRRASVSGIPLPESSGRYTHRTSQAGNPERMTGNPWHGARKAWSRDSPGTPSARRIAHCSGHPAGHEQQLALAGLLTGTSSPILAFPDPKRGPVVLRGQAPCLQLRGQFHFVPRRASMSGGGGWIPYVAGVQWMADDSTRATSVGYASKTHQWRVMAPKDGRCRPRECLRLADLPCGTKASSVSASTLPASNDGQRCPLPERHARVKESLPATIACFSPSIRRPCRALAGSQGRCPPPALTAPDSAESSWASGHDARRSSTCPIPRSGRQRGRSTFPTASRWTPSAGASS